MDEKELLYKSSDFSISWHLLLSDLLILVALVIWKFLILVSKLVANDIEHIFFVCVLIDHKISFFAERSYLGHLSIFWFSYFFIIVL